MKKTSLLFSLSVLLAACGVSTPSSASSVGSSENGASTSLVSTSTASPSSETPSTTSVTTPSSTTVSSSSETTPSSSESVITGISRALFAYLSDLPETDSFLPVFMNETTYTSNANVTGLDYYGSPINKLDLPNRYFGAQLDQLWTHLGLVDSFTQGLTTMLSNAATLGDLYNTYLLGNPNDPYVFSVTVGGFSFLIGGLENELIVNVTVGDVAVTMAVLEVNNIVTYWVELYVNDTNRIIIYSTANELTIVSNLEVSSVNVSFLLNIEKSGNLIEGISYEKYGIGDAALRNYVVFEGDDSRFSVAGERGDFILGASPKVNVETYRVTDGAYLGSQVLETIPVTGPTYETVWYPLWSVSGWSSIQFELDNNDEKEFPQVYLNGSSSAFDVHYNTLPIVGTKTSRKYDIELKKSYIFQTNLDGELEKVEFLYPAFFIQENELGSGPFGTANSRNGNIFSHTLSSNELNSIRQYYDQLKDEQAALKLLDIDQQITDLFTSLNA